MKNITIITGAAGGMGRAIAADLARQGHDLILTDLKEEPLAALADEIGQPKATLVVGGITETNWCERLISACAGRPIGAMIHTAGVSPSMGSGKIILEINLTATQALVAAILPHMAEGATAVLIASNSGHMFARPTLDRIANRMIAGKRSPTAQLMAMNSSLAYSLSKRAVQRLAVIEAPRFGKRGARIVSLSPGIIDTPMGRVEQKEHKQMDRMVEISALGRMGRPSEIASAVAFLISDAASYISGTDLLVDGGTIAGVEAIGGPMKL